MAEKPDYQKYADRAVRERAMEEATGRLRLGTFVALLGPLALGLLWFLKIAPAEHAWMKYGILGTAALGPLLAVVNYLRVPGAGKVAGRTILLLVLAFVFAAATVTLSRHFNLI